MLGLSEILTFVVIDLVYIRKRRQICHEEEVVEKFNGRCLSMAVECWTVFQAFIVADQRDVIVTGIMRRVVHHYVLRFLVECPVVIIIRSWLKRTAFDLSSLLFLLEWTRK
jgi:hypothetical protein